MKEGANIDPTLRSLGGIARYQNLQLLIINIGAFGASYQLLDNIFIGREVLGGRCAAPGPDAVLPGGVSNVSWTSSNVTYGQCDFTVSSSNGSGDSRTYDCQYGHQYGYDPELSFRTEFDLVCDRKLLGGLVQTFVIIGQGFGAVLSAIVSDRFGRKRTLIASQFGLLAVGVCIGFAPSYAVLAVLKVLVGGFQQGVVTGMATMSLELFPTESRSVSVLIGSVIWGCGACSMSLWAYTLKNYSWRYLQFALSGVSALICIVQLGFMDESLRWLVANGRKDGAIEVLEKAARTNRKDLSSVIRALQNSVSETEGADSDFAAALSTISPNDNAHDDSKQAHDNPTFTASTPDLTATTNEKEDPDLKLEQTLEKKQAEKLTVLDLFRHKVLLLNALVVWFAWFTTALSFFGLYMMSTSLHGNRFLNYFLTSLMEIPPGVVLYFMVDRTGRKNASRFMFAVAGLGLVSSGIFRIFSDNSTLATLSVVSAMAGMFGASGMFGAVFFFTPELFPTNLRNQALGVASFAGRLGGMIAPFMNNLAEEAIWAPGVLIGTLCFLVVVLLRFIPETRGKELPHTILEIKAWGEEKSSSSSQDLKNKL